MKPGAIPARRQRMTTRDRSNGSLGPVAESPAGHEARPTFRCECWRQDCTERIPLSREDWKMVRAEPTRFAVAPNHVAENFEAVGEVFPGFWLIEKFGHAGEFAEELAGSDLRRTRR